MIYSLPSLNWVVRSTSESPALLQPLERIVEAAAAAGFDGIGVDDVAYADFRKRGGTTESLAGLLERAGLRCTDVGVLLIGEPGARKLAEVLAELGATARAGVCIAAVTDPSLSYEAIVSELAACADVLEPSGLRLALEWAPYGGVATMAEAYDLCERVGWERCGLLIDAWHVCRSGESWNAVRALDRSQIALVHADDAPPVLDDDLVFESRFRRVPLGKGCLEIERFAHTLGALGYTGVVSLEVLSTELRAETPERAAELLHASLREAWLPAL